MSPEENIAKSYVQKKDKIPYILHGFTVTVRDLDSGTLRCICENNIERKDISESDGYKKITCPYCNRRFVLKVHAYVVD